MENVRKKKRKKTKSLWNSMADMFIPDHSQVISMPMTLNLLTFSYEMEILHDTDNGTNW